MNSRSVGAAEHLHAPTELRTKGRVSIASEASDFGVSPLVSTLRADRMVEAEDAERQETRDV